MPGQKKPNVIVLTQPKRFGLDIADYMAAVKAAENVDFSRRYKLYDLYEDILMDTHLSCVLVVICFQISIFEPLETTGVRDIDLCESCDLLSN